MGRRLVWRDMKMASVNLLVFSFVVLVYLSVPAFALEKIRIASSSPSVGSLPYFLAVKKGFYGSEGLEPEIIFVRANIAITALITGELDFITFLGSPLRASLRGLPVKNVMVVMSNTDHFLVSRPEIRELNGLRGKRIGISSPGATVDYEARAALHAEGLRPGIDAFLLAMGGQELRMAALESGTVDATVLDSVRTVLMSGRGFHILANFRDLIQMPLMGIAVSHDKIKSKPDQVLKIVRATAKAVRFIKENPLEAQRALAQLLAIRETDLSRRVYEMVVGLFNDQVLPDSVLQPFLDEEREQIGVKRRVSVSEVIDWSFLRQIQEKK